MDIKYIKKYEDYYKEFIKNKNPALLKAIEMAERHRYSETNQLNNDFINLEDIMSDNPFQRISRSKVKELNIKTSNTNEADLFKMLKNMKKIRKTKFLKKKTIQIIDNNTQTNNEKQIKSIKSEDYIQNLDECVNNLVKNVKEHKKIQIKYCLNRLSQLISDYSDFSLNNQFDKLTDLLKLASECLKSLSLNEVYIKKNNLYN